MGKRLLWVVGLMLIAASAVAQPADQWLREYGTDFQEEGWAICQAGDGELVMFGVSRSPAVRLFVIKVDEFGNLRWYRALGTGMQPRDIITLPDGGFVLAATRSNNGLLIWLDEYGNTVREEEIDFDQPVSMQSLAVLDDGGFVAAGWRGVQPVDLLMTRYDASGTQLWNVTLQSPFDDTELVFDLDQAPTGEIVAFTTAIADGIGPNRIHVTYITLDGVFQDGIFLPNIDQSCAAGKILDNGDVLIAGERGGQGLAMKYAGDGTQYWELLDPATDAFVACDVRPDGGYVFGGNTVGDESDFYAVTTDADGTVEWTLVNDRAENNLLRDVLVYPDGAIYGFGYTDCVFPTDAELWAIGKEERESEYTIFLRSLDPNTDIPADGGVISYQIRFTNLTGEAQEVRVLRQGFTPSQQLITLTEATQTLQPGNNPGFDNQPVPGFLPPGPYTLIYTLTTVDGDSLLATNSIAFEKLAE